VDNLWTGRFERLKAYALAILSSMNTSEWEAGHAEHNRDSLPDRRCNLGGGIELHAGREATPHEAAAFRILNSGWISGSSTETEVPWN
jgi:hypothetical protein